MNYGTLTYECIYVEESIYYVLYIFHYYLRNTAAFNCDNGQSSTAAPFFLFRACCVLVFIFPDFLPFSVPLSILPHDLGS
jgi:hypothetical protein